MRRDLDCRWSFNKITSKDRWSLAQRGKANSLRLQPGPGVPIPFSILSPSTITEGVYAFLVLKEL